MNTVKTINPRETTALDLNALAAEIEAATFYEEKFVPALFKSWSPLVIEAADIGPGDRVLDVACGSGVVSRDIAVITGDDFPPVGLDIAAGMLEVANAIAPQIEWQHGSAEQLPFEDGSFDRVVCQYGLMFFPDKVKSLSEMLRVLRPGGRLAVAVWDSLDNNPGFAHKVEILQHKAGTAAADALRAPFCLGDIDLLRQFGADAGIRDFKLSTHRGQARFNNLREFVDAELRGWLPVMDVHLTEAQIDGIYHECEQQLSGYCNAGKGEFIMPTSAHIFSGLG